MPDSEFQLPAAGTPCGGFAVEFGEGGQQLRLLPGDRLLPQRLPAAVLQGLADAPRLLARAIRLAPTQRPYQRVEVTLRAGALTQGEALGLASGCIRLWVGEEARIEEAGSLALHEALHLLLAASLRGGGRWNDPELAFADWIVRGIESGLGAQVPRFRAPLPRLFDPLPVSRAAVQQQLAAVAGAPAEARRLFGEALLAGLQQLAAEDAGPEAICQRQLWLVEAALGTHYLESAGRLEAEDGAGLLAVLLDDWLLDYEQYASAVGNPPSAAGSLWRLSEAAWSGDPLVRLAVAAQGLQLGDQCWFAGARLQRSDEPLVWKNRGRVRLPLLPAPARPRPEPIHGFRAALREVEAPREARLVEEAARAAPGFEARALWPRVLARLLAAEVPAPGAAPSALPLVQLVDGEGAAEAFAAWSATVEALRALLGERAAWLPPVLAPQRLASIAEAPRHLSSITLVHAEPASAPRLLDARRLAVHRPVRGALFLAADARSAGEAMGALHERLPDVPPPLDPRYREEAWTQEEPPARLADLPALVDRATAAGRLSSPLSHLLAIMAPGLEECHYPPPQR